MTEHVVSKDGTQIAFDRIGAGPPLVLVVGAFNDRATGAPLAAVLAPRFTVYTYDRRGRGDSGDELARSVRMGHARADRCVAVACEVEDLAALLAAAGGSAALFGFSSGTVLALEAAAHGLPITRLALYDVPWQAADGTPPVTPAETVDHAARLAELLAAGQRGAAVEYFQTELVGIPPEVVAQMRHAPFRAALEAMAPTLVYDALLVGDGRLRHDLLRSVGVPTLVLAGGAGPAFMRSTAQAVAAALPQAEARILADQKHDLEPLVLGRVLADWLAAPRHSGGLQSPGSAPA